jgi:hypothetical protein
MSSFESQRTATALSFTDGGRQSRFMRHEEKQENLSRFCGYYLDRLSVRETPTAEERRVTILARAPTSPVARAVLDAQAEIASLGVSLQVLFAKIDPSDCFSAWLDFADAANASTSAVDIRWARREALIDAHEQLVLGTSLSWAGDCMRREPEKRDAYEQFDTFDTAAATLASGSFTRFWAMSERVYNRRSLPAGLLAAETPHDVLTGAVLANSGPVVGTRH